MIYFDGTHMMTDGDLEELHAAADFMKLNRVYFQDQPIHPRYAVTQALVSQLLANCTTDELLTKCGRCLGDTRQS